ncbi:hypothetical protein A3J33_01625 [candidate division WWE3 bacterium RIFCSPLOWO2_02_FULL_53_10]|uniref:LVIVD repeat protein n=1 Tax=candidate division WWE3 bacterium RIFCSPLOWO2_02_FULL_53_10 TaxID=1802629 RepID=A0A1F4W452_UNCKA|nr:MAG: hypothetical protein A3J33_01625 [candidate division WWE3 bacterium RIFCSPLOWO2_02_FULL_53_10]
MKLLATGYRLLTSRSKRAFTIVEVILAMGLFVLVVGGGVGAAVRAFSLNRLGEEESYAHFLANEGLEAARAVSSRDYFNLVNGSHGLTTAGSQWNFSGSSNTFGKFTRTIIISNVYRDAEKNIIASGGTLDLYTKRAESRVTWNFSPGRSESASFKTYLTAYSQFSICIWDSAVQVGGADLPGGGDAQDIDVLDDYAYVTAMKNGSAGEFFILSIADPINPQPLGEFEVGDHAFSVEISGNYAYLATAKSGSELIVVNVSDPSFPTLTRVVDVPNVTQANDISISGNYAYIVTQSSTSGPEVYVYDISSPSSPSLAGSFEVGNHVYGIYVTGGRAYLANARSDKELIVLDVSNPASPVELGSFNIPSVGANGQSVFYGGGVVHLTTRNNTGSPAEYYLFEASDPSDIQLLGSLDTSGRTNGVESAPGFAILATEKADQELMIVSTADPGSLQIDFSLDLGGSALGVALKDCFGYFTSADDNQEIKVVAPE